MFPPAEGKTVKLRAVRANLGFTALYRRQIEALVSAMHADISGEIGKVYRGDEEKGFRIAQDATPAAILQGVIRRLTDRWRARFDQGARELAAFFAKGAAERTDTQLRMILKRAGFSIPFSLTPAMRDVVEASVAENVSLIKSIGSEYLTQVEGHVMRSVALGRDLSTLTRELQAQYGVTKRRAAFIARDQNNKATAAITRARQVELGIEVAIWRHSHAGKTPRPEHVAFDGQRYEVQKGAFLEGKWTWPGVEPNCRCFSQSVIPKLT